MSRRVAQDEAEMNSGSMGASIFRAYRNALNRERSLDWDDLSDDQRLGWVAAAEAALDVLEDAQELPWVTLAARMFGAWAHRVEYPLREYNDLDLVIKAAWVVAARHAANLCALDGEDPTPHEERWIGAANGLVTSQTSNA